ncbi:MAG: YggS family pyridoxal phosphate enzyme [Beggiatoa sp. IS2]|nr:MAG: YggS family pyridoxal phosphate enzyme [Beggiatoa sp. IS2]
MSTIATALTIIHQKIKDTAQQFNRPLDSIQLLAVSKTRPLTDVVTAIEQGQYYFGENQLQDALPKILALAEDERIQWHFIGTLQTNKTRLIAENFDWIQSLASLKQAQRLNAQRPSTLPPLNVCIQVNISAEPQKTGICLAKLSEFAHAVTKLPRLHLRGLMTLPAYSEDFNQQRIPFRTLHTAYCELQTQGFDLDTLSMGMTDDMVAAIAEGSTMVRVGTGIFGARG